MTTGDSWMRDTGPFVINDAGRLRGIDWRFNAWGGLEGGLYFPWDRRSGRPEGVGRWKACRCTTPTSSSRQVHRCGQARHSVDHRTMPAESSLAGVSKGRSKLPLQYLERRQG